MYVIFVIFENEWKHAEKNELWIYGYDSETPGFLVELLIIWATV